MDRAGVLFSLFQLTDSFFPSGGFAYSWGLETCVNEGLIRDASGLEAFLKGYLFGLVSRCDTLIVKLAYEAADRNNIPTLFRLDNLINAMKLSKESREGSIQIGKQILKVMGTLHEHSAIKRLSEGIEMNKAWGHYPVVFGVVCRILGASREEAVLASLYQAVSCLVSAGLRLIPLGHMEGQKTLEKVRPLLAEIAESIIPLGEEDISSFAPGIEIMAMRHQYLYTRLFRS